ncbi:MULTISPECIES: exopolysaccharide biosynthesis polyprenyl glycosylphosphotransferase [Mumia]|uniref:exopolysaccharide biosynthesis polyprenyl glycosylphosphotransferase n=1 Tax=Mumia TaxID=1546255 RepID=UPI001423BB03|nr:MULTISPECIES: exopolysaccharide biosynthesis polyprenyl glycosylphosphotransferase [unclassified Mumia]QMW67118.1 exopolysaccharide biosynthesis polyprenyl glycosylphosphotransferase [Mumia sp. ZJ1417]
MTTARGAAFTTPSQLVVKMRNRSRMAALAFLLSTLGSAFVAAVLAPSTGYELWLVVAAIGVLLAVEFATIPAYERTRSLRPARRLVVCGSVGVLVLVVFEVMSPATARASLLVVLTAATLSASAVVLRRIVASPVSLLLVGDRDGVGHFLAQWSERSDIEMKGICLVTEDDEAVVPHTLGGVPVVGALTDVGDAVGRLAVDGVMVAPGPSLSAYDVRRINWALDHSLVELTVATEVHGAWPHRVQPRVLGRRLVLSVRPGRRPRLVSLAKAMIDRVGSGALLLLLSPLFLAVAVAVRVSSPGPVFFRQIRTGMNGEPFAMLKFRTMVVNAEELVDELLELNEGSGPLFKLHDDPRVTRVGKILRKTSLDELPQLINVVRGDMSLIGPRPGLPREAETYDSWIRHRLEVKPGMTGLWQVSGRSNLSWQDSVRLDIDYVDNWTIRSDLAIVARTARAVIKGDGAR